MVKKATFLHILLAAVILVIIGAYGLAAAKDKLMLKYLPVDHDIEMVRQENNTTANPVLLILRQTNNTQTNEIVKGHIGCLTCREFDKYGGYHCPDCCLYGVNNTLIHCQNMTDPYCPNPGPWPFNSSCVNCTNTFKRIPSECPNKSAKWPQNYQWCSAAGCPGTTRPLNKTKSCVQSAPDSNIWYCGEDNLGPRKACVSNNPARVKDCAAYDNKTAYEPIKPVSYSFCSPNATANMTGQCWEYKATDEFTNCINKCINDTMRWEDDYYEYNNGTLGKKLCAAGNCTSGFSQNCDVKECEAKIKFGCGKYTVSACQKMEVDFSEMLLGNIAEAFQEIDPGFRYKFVARSGEKYMIAWQILCNVNKGDQKYNLYTMVKVWDQERQNVLFDKPVYQSIVHQKALGSTFYINAQTGMDSDKGSVLIPGHAYIVKLYYFLPNDGQTDLEVDISLMQMILYRTKN